LKISVVSLLPPVGFIIQLSETHENSIFM